MTSTIVVGYDRPPASDATLDVAAVEAGLRGAELAVVHVSPEHPATAPPYENPRPAPDRGLAPDAAVLTAETGAALARDRHPGLTVNAQALTGPVAAVLARRARDADLLVVGHRGHGGFAGLVLGSTAVRAVRHSTGPTLVVRGVPRPPRGVVTAAVDVAEPSLETLDFAAAEAERRAARLTVVYASELLWPRPPAGDAGRLRQTAHRVAGTADAALARLIEPVRDRFPTVPVEHVVTEGSAGAVLVAASAESDLIVVGAPRRHPHRHGTHPGGEGDDHGGIRLGPVAGTLLAHADCPVAVVPWG